MDGRVDRSIRVARRVVAAAAALVVAGCTMAVKVGYNNADSLIAYTADSYLGLDDDQTRFLKQRAQALLAWHRTSQLDDYARTLRRIDGQVGSKAIGAADVRGFIIALDDRMVAIGTQAAPDLAALALTLKPGQIDKLEQKLAKDADKARREADRLDRPDGLDDRVHKYTAEADPWFGTLSPGQRDLVRASLAARPGGARGWSDEVAQRGQDLARLLRRIVDTHPDPAVATEWVRDYIARLPAPDDPKRRAFLEANRQANAELIARLLATSTPRQRGAVHQRLADYIEDCVTLAARRTDASSPPGPG